MHERTHLGPLANTCVFDIKDRPTHSVTLSSPRSAGDGHVQKRECHPSVCLRQGRLEKLSSILTASLCSMAQMKAWLKLIKPRPVSVLGKGFAIVPVPVLYFVVKISMKDFVLTQHQKWHEGC